MTIRMQKDFEDRTLEVREVVERSGGVVALELYDVTHNTVLDTYDPTRYGKYRLAVAAAYADADRFGGQPVSGWRLL